MREGTRLVQRSAPSLERCHELFGLKSAQHPEETVLVLMPKRSIFSFFMAVPHGMDCLLYKQGRFIRTLEPGFHNLPPWYNVQYAVTKQYAIVDMPVQSCPTHDNIPVVIDVNLAFHITNGEVFIMRLGPDKLGETLRSIMEENVRALARTVTYDKVYTLSGTTSEEMLGHINHKVNPFGVAVTQVTITSIHLPQDMAASLENATTFDKKRIEADRKQIYDLRSVKDTQEFDATKKELEFSRLASEEKAEKERTEIQKQLDVCKAEHSARLEEIRSQMGVDVLRIEADAKKQVAEIDANKHKIVQEITAGTDAEVHDLLATSRADVHRILATAKATVAQNKAKALETKADAEAVAAPKLRVKREHEFERVKLSVLEAMANNESMLMTGKGGMMISSEMSTAGPRAEMQAAMMDYSMGAVFGSQKR